MRRFHFAILAVLSFWQSAFPSPKSQRRVGDRTIVGGSRSPPLAMRGFLVSLTNRESFEESQDGAFE